MKYNKHWIWALIVTVPSFVMAQPADEEVSPIAPELNIEIMDAPEATEAPAAKPAPAAHSQAVQPILPATPAPAKVPVAEAAPKAEAKEDKSVKGITLSPSLTIKPIGYNASSKQNYFEISPSAEVATTFKTSGNRDVNLTFGYSFSLSEFLNKRDDAGLRSFEHGLSGSAGINWTDAFSTNFAGSFTYALTAALERGHEIVSDESATGTFKINDQVSITTGYHLFYYNAVDSKFYLSDGTLPNDADEVRQGNSALGGFDPYNTDPFSVDNFYDPAVGSQWFANNGLMLKSTYKPMPSTPVTLSYEYVFNTFTNTPDLSWKGHFIALSVAQDMPWKGGKVSLTDQVRIRNYDVKTNGDGTMFANVRNRLTLSLTQSITDSISSEIWYRWEMRAANADQYAVKTNENYIYAGFTFGF